MALEGKEKIWFLINKLEKERTVTSAGKPIGLHLADNLNKHYTLPDLLELSEKLENEENAIKIVGGPSIQTRHKVLFNLLPGFDTYVTRLEEDPEYLEWCGKKPKVKKAEHGIALGNTIDFSKPAKENKDKYISSGQALELWRMSKEERDKIVHQSLTAAHKASMELLDPLKIVADQLPAVLSPSSPPSVFLPPNYEAQNNALLKQMVENQTPNTSPQHEGDETLHQIIYTPSRQIILDGPYQLSHPDYGSENEIVFEFLYNHPNERFTKEQIEQQINQKLQKDFHKIIENLGFRGDLRRLFFDVSVSGIRFKRQVTIAECKAMGAYPIRLNVRDRKS